MSSTTTNFVSTSCFLVASVSHHSEVGSFDEVIEDRDSLEIKDCLIKCWNTDRLE